MKIKFFGTGEAFDNNLANTSILLLDKIKLLLDCGYNIPQKIWQYNDDPNFIDAIYISHAHADHYFGLPALILRMIEDKRGKKLTIICQNRLKTKIISLLKLGYVSILKNNNIAIEFIELTGKETIKFKEYQLSFANTIHPQANLAIKISVNNIKICYSGDGKYSKRSEELYRNSDLLINDAYMFKETNLNHSNITNLVTMVKKYQVRKICLVHMFRNTRINELEIIKKWLNKEKINAIIPKDGDIISI